MAFSPDVRRHPSRLLDREAQSRTPGVPNISPGGRPLCRRGGGYSTWRPKWTRLPSMAERKTHGMRLLAQRSGRPLHRPRDRRYRRLLAGMISQLFLVVFSPRNMLTSLGFLGLFRHRSGSLIEFDSACLLPGKKKHKHHDANGCLRRSRCRENVRIRQILLQGGWRPGRAEQPLSRKRTAMRRLLTGLVLLLVAAAIVPVALILLNAADFSA